MKKLKSTLILIITSIIIISCNNKKSELVTEQSISDSLKVVSVDFSDPNIYPVYVDKTYRIRTVFLVNDSIKANVLLETGIQNPFFEDSFTEKLNIRLKSSPKTTSKSLLKAVKDSYLLKDSVKINDTYFSGLTSQNTKYIGDSIDIVFPLIDLGNIVELDVKRRYIKKINRDELDSIYLKDFLSFDMAGNRYEYFSIETTLTAHDSTQTTDEISGRFMIDLGCGNAFMLDLRKPEVNQFFNLSDRMLIKDSARILNPGYANIKVLEPRQICLSEMICIEKTHIIGVNGFASKELGYIGCQFINQFITIFDFKQKKLYLKPSD